MELGLVWLHFGHMELGALGAGVPHFGHMELGALGAGVPHFGHRIWGCCGPCGFFLDIWSWGLGGWAGVPYPLFWT